MDVLSANAKSYATGVNTKIDALSTNTKNYAIGLNTKLDTLASNTKDYAIGLNKKIDTLAINTENYAKGISSKLDLLTGTVNVINTTTKNNNDLITKLSLSVGNESDSATTNTVFGRLNQISDITGRIEQQLIRMETTIDEIKDIVDVNQFIYIDNYVISDMVLEYNRYATNNPTATETQRIKNLVAWLRARGYVAS